MKTPATERTPTAKAGWLVVLLMAGWLVFLFVPWPTKPKPESAPRVPVPPSKLVQAGLRDYTDWEALPEIFAIWADRAEWRDGRTEFAYWHPVMKTYSYYFEVVRVKGGFHFKEIAEPRRVGYEWDESLGADCPIRFYRQAATVRGTFVPPGEPPITIPANEPQVKVEIAAPESKSLEPEPPKPPEPALH